jgi:hypothetical protein
MEQVKVQKTHYFFYGRQNLSHLTLFCWLIQAKPLLVRRCNGTIAGPGYLEVDYGCLAKILPWAVNLCSHYQAVGCG